LERTAVFYAPTGRDFSVKAGTGTLRIYLWVSPLPDEASFSPHPLLTTTLWNTTYTLTGFEGTAQEQAITMRDGNFQPARMQFLFWPGTGSPHLCLHCGVQEPGQTFGVHVHPVSEELFLAVEGKGQVYLGNQWFDMAAGDLLYAPAGLPHGARNPFTGIDARRFVTCGGPTPFDKALYEAAGLSGEYDHDCVSFPSQQERASLFS
jgi:Mannose-6-phosphate isomerase